MPFLILLGFPFAVLCSRIIYLLPFCVLNIRGTLVCIALKKAGKYNEYNQNTSYMFHFLETLEISGGIGERKKCERCHKTCKECKNSSQPKRRPMAAK